MSSLDKLHDQAMKLADAAALAASQGETNKAYSIYLQAYTIEVEVAHQTEEQPLRSTIYYHAAKFALLCGMYDEARNLATEGLMGQPAPDRSRALQELLDSIPSKPITVGKRYQLVRPLGNGGMGVVYEAIDRLTSTIVALKRVNSETNKILGESDTGSIDIRLALAKEFRILASLRHPNIISVLDYGFDDARQPYFTMDLLERPQTILEYAQDKPFDIKVNLLIQLLHALAYLHRRGVIHRDLKPANVQVAADQVKVLDFGLSQVRGPDTDTTDYVSGTLNYLAPELLTQGGKASMQSDFYAVGVIAYEMFVKHHPYEGSSLSRLLDQIIHEVPDFSSPQLAPDLAKILERLMAKSPQDRYGDSIEIIQALAAEVDLPLSAETQATRESFLQGAEFTGREAELAQLTNGLADALEGRGSFWLIGGESGIGKSRLLDELRIRALVSGALVLRGQSVIEGGGPYHLWHDLIRWLALSTKLSDLEAGVLKQIAPDIELLIGRAIPKITEVEPRSMKDRLLTVIEDVFRRQQQPTVVILEDLQWEVGNLDILIRLGRIATELPLLIVASYRDDEKTDLTKSLPHAKVLSLKPLSIDDIRVLSESMLGPHGRTPHVVDFLQKETEGNVFFLVEVVRALAEESGGLDKIAEITLPSHVLSRGIKQVVERRLKRIASAAFPLLQRAAVYGRQLDPSILTNLAPDIDIANWLVSAAEANVLEVFEGTWRFAHDKLREEVLAELTSQQSQSIHGELALTIEHVYGDSPQYVIALAQHWAAANNPEKEFQYVKLAGEAARRTGLDNEALDYFERTLVLDTQLRPGPLTMEQKLQRAHLKIAFASIYYNQGKFIENIQVTKEALELLGEPLPGTPVTTAARLVQQVTLQVFSRLAPGVFARRTKELRILEELQSAYHPISQAYYFRNAVRHSLYCVVRRLNVSQAMGSGPQYAKASGAFAYVLGLVPLHWAAKDYSQRAIAMAGTENNETVLPDVLSYVANYYGGTEKFRYAEELHQQAISICERIKNIYLAVALKLIYSWVLIHCEGDLVTTKAMIDDVYVRAQQNNYLQQQIWALNGQCQFYRCYTSVEDLESIVAIIEKGLKLLEKHNEPQEFDSMLGVRAMIRLHQGKKQSALEDARILERNLENVPPLAYTMLGTYSNIAEVFLRLLEEGFENPEIRRSVQRSASKVCNMAQQYAKRFPIGVPQAALWKGFYAYLQGKHRRAQTLWHTSLQSATKLDMSFHIARAHYYLGRYGNEPTGARKNHLEEASKIFERLGATYDTDRTKQALASL